MAGISVQLSPSSGLSSALSAISSAPLGQADIAVQAGAGAQDGTSSKVVASVNGLSPGTITAD